MASVPAILDSRGVVPPHPVGSGELKVVFLPTFYFGSFAGRRPLRDFLDRIHGVAIGGPGRQRRNCSSCALDQDRWMRASGENGRAVEDLGRLDTAGHDTL